MRRERLLAGRRQNGSDLTVIPGMTNEGLVRSFPSVNRVFGGKDAADTAITLVLMDNAASCLRRASRSSSRGGWKFARLSAGGSRIRTLGPPSTVSSLHPRARHDPRRHREARNADSFVSTSSPCDLQHAWGAFHMDRALSSRSASDGFEHLAASFSPSRASFEIYRGDRRPNEAPKFRFCGVGVDWTPQ
jgi:hypothetical protein